MAEPLKLTRKEQIPGSICQYLRRFQLEAVQFVHRLYSRGEFCVLNDESGMGKSVAVAALLLAIGSEKKSLIIANDDQLVNGWQFHLGLFCPELSCALVNEGKFS